jgi:hypothetical protein
MAVQAPDAGSFGPTRDTPKVVSAVVAGVTAKSMNAVAAPSVTAKSVIVAGGWERVAVDVTRRSGMPRIRWVLTGALFGLALALVVVLLLR